MLQEVNWTEVNNIIGNIYKHICVHVTYADYKIVLGRNNIFIEAVVTFGAESIQ